MALSYPLVEQIRAELAAAADPQRAPQMQRYMKSAMPYRGVAMPAARKIFRAAIKQYPLSSRAELEQIVRELYDQAEYREERYGALAVLRHPRSAAWLDGAALRLLEHLVETGGWWDLVDETSHCIGAALLADPDAVRPALIGWSQDDDMWLRRSSIIAQIGHRERTDRALLTATIEANLTDREFFIRKAIGWALREYSKTDEDWVRAFIDAHPGLSPLSRREAVRRLSPRQPAE